MKSYLALAWKELKAQKITAILILVAVIMSTIMTTVIGAVFGYVCCIFVGAAQTDALQLVAVPVMAIVEAAIISIVACLLATAIPLRSIARMSIVDSIETVE